MMVSLKIAVDGLISSLQYKMHVLSEELEEGANVKPQGQSEQHHIARQRSNNQRLEGDGQ